MKINKATNGFAQVSREKGRNGLWFGLFAGLGLALGTWGYDAWILNGTANSLPWIKFFIGLPFSLLIGGIAGWLSARIDNALIGAFLWIIAGLAQVIMASFVPFQAVSTVLGWLAKDYVGLDIYPFVESITTRRNLLFLAVGIFSGLAGAFEMFFVDAASRASTIASRFFTLMTCMLFFIPIGLMADNLINQPLRIPIVAVHDLIQSGLEAEIKPVSKEKARDLGLRALRAFGDLIHRPYHLSLGMYDPLNMSESTVNVDFEGTWGVCFVLENRPLFCQQSVNRYLAGLDCLLKTKAQACKLKVIEGAEEDLEAARDFIHDTQPKYGIIGQKGNAILLLVSPEDDKQMTCVMREAGDLYYESCKPTPAQAFSPLSFVPTPRWNLVTPTANPQARLTPSPAAGIVSQSAMLPSINIDDQSLRNAPHYDIKLDLDYLAHSFQGTALVDYTNTETKSLEEIYFRLLPNGKRSYGNGSLQVSDILIDDQPVGSTLSAEDTVLKVDLPVELAPGEKIQVKMEFEGRIPRDFGGDETPLGYGIYNISEGVLSLSGWYPILAVYDQQGWNLDPVSYIGDSVFSDTAFYTVEVTAPADLVMAATGVQVDRTSSGETARMRFESGPVRDFYLVASPDFLETSQRVDGTLVNSYYQPGNQQGGEKALSIAADSLRVFNDRFGPYPYTELDIVQAPMRNALGVEYPGIVLIAADLYSNPEIPDFIVTTAHEVAHQWWYQIVGNDVFEEPWLDEALATYSSSLYIEEELDSQYLRGLVDYWQQRYDRILEKYGNDEVTQTLAHFENTNNGASYAGIVYIKGALFFKELRVEIGDEAFFQALRAYFRSNAFGIASREDLLKEFETASGRHLDEFFNQWLYENQ